MSTAPIRRSRVVAVVAALVCSACGAATGATQSATSSIVTTNPGTDGVPIVGGSNAQRQAMRQILNGVDTSQMSEVDFTTPPDAFQSNGAWVNIQIPDGDSEPNIESEWAAALVAGSFHDVSTASGLPDLSGYSDPQGSTVVHGDHPDVTIATAPISTLSSTLSSLGLTPTSIQVFTPDADVAVRVVATTSDAQTLLTDHPNLASDVFGDLNQYDGTYLEVDDSQGPAYVSAYASRAAQGVGWTRAGLPNTRSSSTLAVPPTT